MLERKIESNNFYRRNELNKNNKQIYMIHLAILLFGSAGVIGKYVSVSALIVTLWRVVTSAIFLFALIKIKKIDYKIANKKDLKFFIVAGIVMAIHWTSFMHAIQVSSVAIGTITFATFPLYVTFLEPFFFEEKLKFRNIIEALLIIVGVLITIPEFSLGNSTTQGVLWGILGSFTYAILSLMNRKLTSKYVGVTVCFYEQLVAAIILLPSAFILKPVISGQEMILLTVLGVICTAVAHTLFVSGLKTVKVQTASIISGMEPVYATFLAFIFLGNAPSIKEVIGGIVILTVTIYSSLRSGKELKSEK